jgi:HD superfamily phosphodiesterase
MRLGSSAVFLVLLVMPGCGGEDASFTEDYNEAVTPISELRANLDTRLENYDRLADRTRETRRNLARLEAPEGAAEELDALVAGLDDVTTSLMGVARAARSDDPVRERRAAQGLQRSNDEFRRAENALRRAVEG